MAKKRYNLTEILAKIKESLSLLPGEEEKEEMTQSIQGIIQELKLLQERIARFPLESDKERISGATHVLVSFFDSLKDNPILAGILLPQKTKSRKQKSEAVDVNALQQQIEMLPTEKILEELAKHKKDTLIALSAKMNITANKKLTKEALADRIFKLGYANKRGYDLLKG
ncbi:MAG: hypothetical protein ACUBOA_07135 [Candidatus Loosdrechtia sp.]|uniref:hypothetical protein n=1 Tax=Candidatus Loosdrechtia sp. TaxID=3101272 RepID=UPI003A6EF83B|nr:MAG: hypothetical protein QY305_01220 [Candidatus Jettenia sp. AMX2]